MGSVDPMGLAECSASKEFIKQHDATELFLGDMNIGKTTFLNSYFPKLSYAAKSGDQESYFNIKYRTDYKNIAYDPINGTNDCNSSSTPGACMVYVNKQKVELSQLGNFFIGYNGFWTGFTLDDPNGTMFNDIYMAGYFTEDLLNRKNFLNDPNLSNESTNDEIEDRKWYAAGYKMAQMQKDNLRPNLRGILQSVLN